MFLLREELEKRPFVKAGDLITCDCGIPHELFEFPDHAQICFLSKNNEKQIYHALFIRCPMHVHSDGENELIIAALDNRLVYMDKSLFSSSSINNEFLHHEGEE